MISFKFIRLILLIMSLCQVIFSQAHGFIRYSPIYCDSIINADLYKAVYCDSIFPKGSYINTRNYSDLLKEFDSNFSRLTIKTLNNEVLSSKEYSLNGRIVNINTANIALADIKYLQFREDGSILKSILMGGMAFCVTGFIFSMYEGYDCLIGNDHFELDQVLITASVGSIIGFISGALGYDQEKIEFKRD